MNRNNFRGTGVALVTPFTKTGEIDYDAFGRVIEHVLAGGIGVDYLVPIGTTGESVTLSKAEKQAIFKFVVEKTNNRVPIVAGIGGNNTREILDAYEHTDLTGISAILSVCPYYNKPNQEGIYQHYKTVCDNAPLPVILYNVPGRTGVNMTAETTLRIAHAVPNAIAIKEASGNFDQFMQIIKNKPKDFLFISGDDGYTLPMIALGADGVISVVANVYPKEFCELVNLALAGKMEDARVLQYRLIDIINLLFAEGSPGGAKAFLKQMNICGDTLRQPLANVSEQLYAKIAQTIKQF